VISFNGTRKERHQMAFMNRKRQDKTADKKSESSATPKSRRDQQTGKPGLSGVKNIIAIASGKGGVGKSSVATNLAVALRHSGSSVGLLDADIYGPSQPGMFGAGNDRPKIIDNRITPLSKHGISFISMGLLPGSEGPVVWRAPLAIKIIHQFLGNVLWGELDYLLIDLPPGTGDVQLTLAQQASLTGAIIVTTPQEIALGVARKGLKMFEQVNVPILGIIENMSGFTCKHCGNETPVFGAGGGKLMAGEYNVPLLGTVPLDPEIMMSGEDGIPVLEKSPDSPASKAYLDLVGKLKESVDRGDAAGKVIEPRHIELSSDSELRVRWPDGHEGSHTAYYLRINCKCAACQDEDTGRRTLDPDSIPLDIKFASVGKVGRYAIQPDFSDGHNTGIYSFQKLRELCECSDCMKARKEDGSFSV
jgi:ATP-binding protein involved in chromosome partitioning